MNNSEKILNVGHWFKSGDLIASLPGLRHLYRKNGVKTHLYQKVGLPISPHENPDNPLINEYGQATSMNDEMFRMIKPLLEYQSYIERFEEWNGEEVEFNTLATRDSRLIPIPNSDLHFWMFFIFPNLSCDLSEPWIEVPPNGNIFHELVTSEHAIINRTGRFTNPYISYHFLKNYKDRIIFSGTENEHKKFCNDWDLDIPRLIVKDFLELAQAINSCKFFLGNQSFHFHLSDSIKKKRILEVCASYPNTLPTGANGHAFMYQKALELYFEDFMNES